MVQTTRLRSPSGDRSTRPILTPTAMNDSPHLQLPTIEPPVRPPSATAPLAGSSASGIARADVAAPTLIQPLGSDGAPRSTPPATSGRGGRIARTGIAFVAGAALVAGGFGVAQLTENDPDATDASVVEVSAPTSETAQSEAEGAGPSSSATPPPLAGELEPAAFVAQLLGPSVVQVETNVGLGSGVVFRDGLVMTNHHVIAASSQIQIRTSDGRTFETTLVGSDARNDIAVLRVAEGANLPVAQLSPDAPVVGQFTVAIGSPFQLQQTVTSGIVSALNRPVPNQVGGYNAMLQTDTAINPGNSGGALADRAGRVIGINTSIRTDGTSNSNVGIGFAVPIATALDVADRILAGDNLNPGVLGVSGSALDGEVGVLVDDVTSGGAAEEAGLLSGDRILTVNGAPVTSFDELAGLVQSNFSGDTVELIVERAGELEPVTLSAILD